MKEENKKKVGRPRVIARKDTKSVMMFLPTDLWEKVHIAAKAEDRTLVAWFRRLLTETLK